MMLGDKSPLTVAESAMEPPAEAGQICPVAGCAGMVIAVPLMTGHLTCPACKTEWKDYTVARYWDSAPPPLNPPPRVSSSPRIGRGVYDGSITVGVYHGSHDKMALDLRISLFEISMDNYSAETQFRLFCLAETVPMPGLGNWFFGLIVEGHIKTICERHPQTKLGHWAATVDFEHGFATVRVTVDANALYRF